MKFMYGTSYLVLLKQTGTMHLMLLVGERFVRNSTRGMGVLWQDANLSTLVAFQVVLRSILLQHTIMGYQKTSPHS